MPNDFGNTLKKLREEAGVTVKTVSEHLTEKGFKASASTIYSWENNNSQPTPGALLVMCKLYKVPNVLEAFGYDGYDEDGQIQLTLKETMLIEQYRKLDSYGVDLVDTVLEKEFVRCTKPVQKTHVYTYYRRIACAGDGFLFDDIPPESIEAPECQNADFIIGVNGDSMEPTFCDGDLVYVRRAEDIKTGKCGIFTINNECFIKEKGEDCLISHNPKYPNIAGTKDIRCIGEVLGKVPR